MIDMFLEGGQVRLSTVKGKGFLPDPPLTIEQWLECPVV